MPLYEYLCDACGHRFERIVKFSDPVVDACPSCGGAIRKLMSSPAIQFKGTGFYITDYPKKDQTKDHSTAAKAGSNGSRTASTDQAEKSAPQPDPAPSSSSVAPAGSAPAKDS